MIWALALSRWISQVSKYVTKNKRFQAAFGAGLLLIVVGTLTYSFTQKWSIANSFYFAICTLTTSSIADPSLTLSGEAIKVFTAIYVLVGISILVEVGRQIGLGYMRMHEAKQQERRDRRAQRRAGREKL